MDGARRAVDYAAERDPVGTAACPQHSTSGRLQPQVCGGVLPHTVILGWPDPLTATDDGCGKPKRIGDSSRAAERVPQFVDSNDGQRRRDELLTYGVGHWPATHLIVENSIDRWNMIAVIAARFEKRNEIRTNNYEFLYEWTLKCSFTNRDHSFDVM